MNRKDFFRNSCKFGICACSGALLMNNNSVNASGLNSSDGENDWKLEFVQKRFAKFIEIINSNVDGDTKNLLLEQLGRACAADWEDQAKKYIGNIEGYLQQIQTDWVENAEYDKEKKEIKIFDKPKEKCFCPLVNSELMTKEFCNCTKGWQKQTYETILGEKVDVEIMTSVLRGGDRCSFKIKIID